MRNILLLILGIVDLGANIPYIVDTYRGKTKPNIASWSTFTLINGILAFAGLSAHNALNTAVLGFSYLAGSLCILLLAIVKGTRKYTVFDACFQLLAIVGIVVWVLADDPNIALGVSIVVGELAAVPMYRHAYFYPDEETWSTFMIAGFVALGILCLATSVSFAALAVPIDFFIGNTTLALVIILRRSHAQSRVHKKAQHIL